MKKRNIIVTLLLTLGLLSLTLGVTVSFFNYTRTGSPNTFSTGRIYFNSNQNNTLNITNVFPIKSSEVNPSTLDSVTITINGDTTYTDGEEFLISITDVNDTINNKRIPLNYIATYTANTGGNIGTSSNDYWNERENKDASIYQLNTEGRVFDGKQVLVGYIDNGETGINGTITIKAYVDADRIAITDTPEENSEWQQGRTIFSTTEWNSFQSSGTPISFKIKAESNEGIWVEKEPTPASCFTFSQPIPNYVRNENMDINTCINKFMEWGYDEYLQEEETIEKYCNDKGTILGYTFQEVLGMGDNGFSPEELIELESAEIIIKQGYQTSITDYDASCGSDVVIPSKIDAEFVSYTRNENMNINTCVSYFKNIGLIATDEEFSLYCNGTGTLYGETLQEVLDMNYEGFSQGQLTELESLGIINQNKTMIKTMVTYIFDSSFYDKNLTSVTIPDSVIYIGEGAFKNNQLTNVIIPNDVINNICDGEVFDTSVVIQYKNGSQLICPTKASCFTTTISNGNVSIIDYDTTCGKNVIIPNMISGNNVTAIGAFAFYSNQLTSVIIPNSVTVIDNDAFYDNKLTSITVPNSVTTIGKGAFSGNPLSQIITSDNYFELNSSHMCDISTITQISNDLNMNMNVLHLNNLYNNNKAFVRKIAASTPSNIVNEGVQIINSSGTKQCLASGDWIEESG